MHDLSASDYRSLGDLRFQIRRFIHFSEEAARAEDLEPQQHQLLLTIRALDEAHGPTVGQIATHLFIRHHSAVGLIDRLAERRLVERVRGDEDRRQVRVRLTPEGEEKLRRLSGIHRQELLNSGPSLVAALGRLLQQLRHHEQNGYAKEKDVSAVEERHS